MQFLTEECVKRKYFRTRCCCFRYSPRFDGSDVTKDTIKAITVNTDNTHIRHSMVTPEINKKKKRFL